MARSFSAGSSDVVSMTSFAIPTFITYATWVNITAYRSGDEYRLMTAGVSTLGLYAGNFSVPPSNDWIGFFAAGWSGASGEWAYIGPATGGWHHVAVTYDTGSTANVPIMYLDGVSQTLTTLSNPTGTFTGGTQTVYIGNNSLSTRGLGGNLAEAAFWNRLLTAPEIVLLAKGYAPSHLGTGRLMYFPIDGRTSPERNLATGNTGTVTGTAYVDHYPIIKTSSSTWRNKAAVVAAGTSIPAIKHMGGVPFMTPNQRVW